MWKVATVRVLVDSTLGLYLLLSPLACATSSADPLDAGTTFGPDSVTNSDGHGAAPLPSVPSPEPEVVIGSDARSLFLDNSLQGYRLVLPFPDGASPCPVELRLGARTAHLSGEFAAGRVRLAASSLLSRVEPGGHATLVVGKGRDQLRYRVARNRLIPPVFRDLGPVWRGMAADAREKGIVVSTVVVVLWDASFTGEGMLRNGRRTWWANGTEPANNLNWGGGTGIRAMLLKTPGWRLVAEETGGKLPLQRTVFARTIPPDAFWKGLGVDRPFDATLVLLALDYRDIDEGFRIFADLVRGRDDVGMVSLPGGREVDLARSRIVGMAVHHVPEGPEIVGPELSAIEPKAVFLASCFSATAFGPLLVRKNLFPVFLSIPTTSSEGYIYLPVIEGLFRGSDMHRILAAVDASYYSWHKRHTGETQYTNPSCKGFEKVLSDASDDWDGDDLPNDVDPEPLVPNRRALEPDTGRMRIDLSDGRVIRVDSRDVVR